MTPRSTTSRMLGRAAVVLTVGAVVLTGAPVQATTTGATIDTYSTWTSGSTLQPFGHPDTSTYGQVITIPNGKNRVPWFTYFMSAGPVSGTLKFRGEIYGWDGTKATRKIAQSPVVSLELTAGDPTYYPARMRFEDARVRPGRQYVLFATVSKTYEETDPNVTSIWPVHTTDVLPGGDTVFINDAGDESLWTTQAWVTLTGYDMAFKAKLR